MRPKGKLLIMGGAEDIGNNDTRSTQNRNPNPKFIRYQLLQELLSASRNKKIEIITTGSNVQKEVRNRYERVFKKMDCPAPGFIPIKNKLEARNAQYLERANAADAIFFTGGDQFRLSTILGETEIMDLIKRRYNEEKNFLVAGTSAGAMVMSSIMIVEGGLRKSHIDKELKTTSGLNFLPDCIIDTHFIKRGRFARLAHAVIINPDQLGVGLGDDTALIIKNGTDAHCKGSGMVVIIDGKFIGQTNVTTAKKGEPVFVENLKIHILVNGCRFSIKDRMLAKPAILK